MQFFLPVKIPVLAEIIKQGSDRNQYNAIKAGRQFGYQQNQVKKKDKKN